MNKQEQTKEFENSIGPLFGIRILQYLYLASEEEELKDIMENNKVVHLTFEQGTYTIRWDDLVEKVLNEISDYKEENPDIEFPEELMELVKLVD